MLTNPVPHDFGESFRSLRTSLVFTNGTDGKRMIAVTSTQPLEGKTTTACNLAVALALGGSRVMLIDADMRRPGLHRTMGLQNEVGLSHVLTGQARVREAVQRTSEPNLYVMTAGRTPPNPSELLSSARMQNLIANLQAGPFDWVIIDTPPVLAVTDAVIIAPYVSGLVFVVGAEMTRRAHAERAIETIQSGKPNIIGAVLNRVDLNRNKYYYSRYYGYHYKSYYGSEASRRRTPRPDRWPALRAGAAAGRGGGNVRRRLSLVRRRPGRGHRRARHLDPSRARTPTGWLRAARSGAARAPRGHRPSAASASCGRSSPLVSPGRLVLHSRSHPRSARCRRCCR